MARRTSALSNLLGGHLISILPMACSKADASSPCSSAPWLLQLKSEKIRENPRKSEKIRENPRKLRKMVPAGATRLQVIDENESSGLWRKKRSIDSLCGRRHHPAGHLAQVARHRTQRLLHRLRPAIGRRHALYKPRQ